MLFKRRPTSPFSSEQALSAKPVRAVKAALVPTNNGGTLTVPLAPPRWAGRLFKVPAGATKTFELDAIGVFLWDNIDGRTTVRQLIERLAKRYNLNLRAAQVPTLQFLQTLIRKGLVGVPMGTEGDGIADERR